MPAVNSQPRRARSGNQRDEAARLAVLHAADDLLVEHGFARLTIEAIARQAGVAKQTIYRWWPSKVEILLDTLIEDSEKRFPVPAKDGIRDYFRGYARFVTRDPAGKVLLALIAEAQHSPETAKSLHDRYLGPRRELERELLARGIESGEVSTALDLDAALDAVIGPIVYRALTGANVPRALVDAFFDGVLKP
ncbi:TetR/AcrR family transcriptional regulator [Amycolatopsis sp. NPDC102389]|uniref:TetR/AcrR family transcriptional regulator n=1 Tax=Amycolatopsis sp. NPDC102389 TaxID=3363941 RepID=UPI0037F51399